MWDAATGQETLTPKGYGFGSGVAFSPDGKWIAIASGKWIANGRCDHTIMVWDAATGQETLTLRGHTQAVNSVAFSPDGKRIASGSADTTVKVWDLTTGRKTLTFRGHTGAVQSVAFSPDGKRIASGEGDAIKVWDAATGQETLTLKLAWWQRGLQPGRQTDCRRQRRQNDQGVGGGDGSENTHAQGAY